MSFGSTAFGSTAFGGSANASNEQIFFSYPQPPRSPDILFEVTAFFTGPQEFYEILTIQSSEPGSGPTGIDYEAFISHGEGETPQSQGKFSGNGQSIIAAAPIIVVTAIIDSAIWPTGTSFGVKGRPYTQ